jgi:hypothetical protein
MQEDKLTVKRLASFLILANQLVQEAVDMDPDTERCSQFQMNLNISFDYPHGNLQGKTASVKLFTLKVDVNIIILATVTSDTDRTERTAAQDPSHEEGNAEPRQNRKKCWLTYFH